jgi:cytochrome c551/c552
MKKIFLYLLVFFALIQLVRPKKNKSEVVSQNQITSVMIVPQDVQDIFKRSCNDCHSNHTNYLWYHEIAPMSWMVAYHIKDGKKHLNFDEFGTYNSRKKDRALEEMSEVVESGEMPMKGYVAFHPEAKMSQDDIQKVKDWVTSLNLKHE